MTTDAKRRRKVTMSQPHELSHTPSTHSLRDPVCGMSVDPKQSVSYEHAGQTNYFCSERCRKKFQENPQICLAHTGQRPQAQPAGAEYTCPMHLEASQERRC